MARSHGRILSSIWSDEDFRALDAEPQQLYMMLVSQPNLTHAGTLSITVRRWANNTASATQQSVLAALKVLSDARFVVVDWDTEELLVRTLIRNDGVYKQPRVFQVAVGEVRAIASPKLRSAVRAELERLPLEEVTDKVGRDGISPRAQVQEMVDALVSELPDTPPDTPPGTHADTPGDTHGQGYADGSPTPIGRGIATAPRVTRPRAHAPSPALSPSPSPSPSPTPAVSDGAPNAPEPDTAGTLLADYLDQCRKRPPQQFLAHLGRTIKTLLAEPIDPDDIRDGLGILLERGLNPSALPGAVNEAMNAGRRIRPDGLSDNTRAHLALVEELRAEEAQQQRGIAG